MKPKRIIYSFARVACLVAAILAFQNCGGRLLPTSETSKSSDDSGPTPTPEPDVAFQLSRPLEHEVFSLSRNVIEISVTAERPATLHVRLEPALGGAALFSGTAAIVGGTQTITIPLNTTTSAWRGGWLKLKTSQGSQAAIERTIGLGLLLLTAGQSNSANWECAGCNPAQAPVTGDLVAFLKDSNVPSIDTIPAPPLPAQGTLSFTVTESRAPIANGLQQNVWYPIGKALSARHQIPVGIIAVGIGSTAVGQWANPAVFYPRLSYGKLFRADAVLWHQGESDAALATTGAAYRSTLESLIAKTRTDFGFQIPWFVSIASDAGQSCAGITPANSAVIATAQSDLIAAGSGNGIYAGPNTNLIPHYCHFDDQASFDLYVQSWLNAFENSPLFKF